MTGWLLNIAYIVVIPFWIAARYLVRKRGIAGWKQKFLGAYPVLSRRPGNRIWLHGVSVGEVNLFAALIKRIRDTVPDCQFIITTTTQTGFEVACRKYGAENVYYCPFDFTWSCRRFMDRVKPDCLVLGELELWPNLILSATQREIPIAVVNARLSESSYRGYRKIGWLLRRVIRRVNLILAQNSIYADRFIKLGAIPSRVKVSGSTKFDGVQTVADNPAANRLRSMIGLPSGREVIVAGSTSDPEEKLVGECFVELRRQHPDVRLVIVPRHPDRTERIVDQLRSIGLKCQRRSELFQARCDADITGESVLVVDSVGELSHWWALASIAFVGGSMGTRGGQNMIEPAAYGTAISFGTDTRNFRDVVELLLGGDAAVEVNDKVELLRFFQRCLNDIAWREAMGCRAQQLVTLQSGAAEMTACEVCQLLSVQDGKPNSLRAA